MKNCKIWIKFEDIDEISENRQCFCNHQLRRPSFSVAWNTFAFTLLKECDFDSQSASKFGLSDQISRCTEGTLCALTWVLRAVHLWLDYPGLTLIAGVHSLCKISNRRGLCSLKGTFEDSLLFDAYLQFLLRFSQFFCPNIPHQKCFLCVE